MLKGLTEASAEAWGVKGFPNVRVVKDGARAGDDLDAVKAAVGS